VIAGNFGGKLPPYIANSYGTDATLFLGDCKQLRLRQIELLEPEYIIIIFFY